MLMLKNLIESNPTQLGAEFHVPKTTRNDTMCSSCMSVYLSKICQGLKQHVLQQL